MRYLPLLAALACATTSYDRTMASWQGRNVDALITAWGPPTDTTELRDGTTLLTWRRNGGSGVLLQNAGGGLTAGSRVDWWCQSSFRVRGGRIVSWSWRGNACE